MTEFKEGNYRDAIEAMERYSSRMCSLLDAQESARSDKVFFGVSLLVVLFTAGALAQVAAGVELVKFKVVGILIVLALVFTFLASMVLFIYRIIKVPATNSANELAYTRKKLLELVKYISQVLDHNEFSPPIKFLMSLNLSQAEDLIELTKSKSTG